MKTALVILTYNNVNDTLACVQSVLAHNTAPVRFIVVDNASDQEIQAELSQKLRALGPDITYVVSSQNLGYARGNNLGLKIAYDDPEVDRIMVLNNDVLFIQDIIPTLISRQDSLSDCGIISPILLKPDLQEYDYNCARREESVSQMIRRNFFHYWWRHKRKPVTEVFKHNYLLHQADLSVQVLPIQLPSGSCMLIRKDLMRELGGFDPYTFLYYEENILYKKLLKLGCCNYICPDLKCVHLGAVTTSSIGDGQFATMQAVRSQRYFVRKYSGANWIMIGAHYISTLFFKLSFKVQKALQRK